MFQLNPALDEARLASEYRERGYVRIEALLARDGASRLHESLKGRDDWKQVLNSGDKIFELDREARAAMTAEQAEALDLAVYSGGRDGFQHRYESIRVPDDPDARGQSRDMVADFASWLSGGEARRFLRAVTGEADIDFADAQATAFSPGDFLTAHDDAVPGKKRLAAYVFGLTPIWRTEWGGLVLFHAIDGDVRQGLLPRFNCLNIFAVPQLHSVSMVTKSAAYRRYSVTGWLRAA
jgi:Rps23 Pro-64 3,4-dihydroxylase Tpa1-like proline 4-hydroxylase